MSIHGLPSSTNVTTQTGLSDPLPTTGTQPSHENGLEQIRNQAEVIAPNRQEETLPPPGHPGDGLRQIRSQVQPASHSLDRLSGKSRLIQERLTESLSERLDERLAQMSPQEQKTVKELLHFPWYRCFGMSRQDRLEIRTILAGFLAQGMGLEEGRLLKGMLTGLPGNQLAQMRAEMTKPGANAFKVLSTFLLDPSRPSHETFEQFRRIIQSFPPDLTRKEKVEHVDINITIVRDSQGRPDVAHALSAFVRIGPDKPYPKLSEQQHAQINEAFDRFCSCRYSRMGVPLDLMKAFMEENSQRLKANQEPISLREFFRNWKVDGAQIMSRYGKGDCMNVAQALVEHLNGLGIRAYLGGMYNPELVAQRNADGKSPSDALMNTMGITHLDVLIPYRKDTGEEHVILIKPGMGNANRKEHLLDLPAGSSEVIQRRVSVSQPLDPSRIHKDQLGFLTNLQINNRSWDSPRHIVAGIDLVKGTIYLNKAATEDFRKAHGGDFAPHETALTFNYREALKNPGEKVTVRIWNPDTNGYEDQQLTRLESLALFLRNIQEQFDQPDEFVSNALALMAHEQEYHSDILWPSIRELNQLN